MTMLVLQTLLLMAIAYILGCIIGCLLHQWFGTAEKAVAAPAVAAGVATRVTPPAPPPPPPARAVTTLSLIHI